MGRFFPGRHSNAESYRRTARKVQLFVLLVAAAGTLTACTRIQDTQAHEDPALADTLKTAIQEAYDFSKPGAVQRMGSLYPDAGMVVSASGGRLITSPDSIRKGIATFWENVGHNMRDARWQWNEVHVERLSRNAAALTGSWSVPHIAPDNQRHVIAGAWTAVFVRMDGKWRIVQEHLSAFQ